MDPVLKDITVVQFAYPYTWTKNTGQCFEKQDRRWNAERPSATLDP